MINLTTVKDPSHLLDLFNMDFFDELTALLGIPFLTGFAAATLFVLFTFGVYKAFGLIRIKKS